MLRVSSISYRDPRDGEDRRIEVVNNKLMLVGPSGGGKSAVLRGVVRTLSLASGICVSLSATQSPLHVALHLADGSEYSGRDGEHLDISGIMYMDLCDLDVSVRGRKVTGYSACSYFGDVDDVELARRARPMLRVIGAEDVFMDRVRVGDEWASVYSLPLGRRRALLAVLAVAHEPDVIAIEALDAAMDASLAEGVVDILSKHPGFVVAETHGLTAVNIALKRGWSVYYMDDMRPVRMYNADDLMLGR